MNSAQQRKNGFSQILIALSGDIGGVTEELLTYPMTNHKLTLSITVIKFSSLWSTKH